MSDGAPTIFLATTNPAKERKLRWLLDGLGFALETPRDQSAEVEPEESGNSHREVAAGKALFWSRRVGSLVIASDGGARLPALGDRWNSLLTRRAAGPDADDRARADHLLNLMRRRRGADREVVWVEGLALAKSQELLASWEVARSLGHLVERYDPSLIQGGFYMPALIHVPRFRKVLAQLTSDELVQVDHCWNELRRRVRAFLARSPRA